MPNFAWTNRLRQQKESIKNKIKLIERSLKNRHKQPTSDNHVKNEELSIKDEKDEPNKDKLEESVKDLFHNVSLQNNFLVGSKNDEKLESVKAQKIYRQLASKAIEVIEEQGLCFSLVWPYGVELPGLIHVLATKVFSSERNGRGICTAIYPALTQSLSQFRHIHLDANDLLHEARKSANIDIDNLHIKYKAYLTLNEYERNPHLSRVRCNPSIRDIIPIFQYSSETYQIERSGEHYLRDFHRVLWSAEAGRREAIENAAAILDDPNETTDAMFRFGINISPKGFLKILPTFSAKLDLLILDIRNRNIRKINNWKYRLSKLIYEIRTTYSNIGILTITDDPLVYKNIRYEYIKLLKKPVKKYSGQNDHKYINKFTEKCHLRIYEGIWKESLGTPKNIDSPTHTSYEAVVTGQRIMALTNSMLRTANSYHTDGSDDVSRQIRSLANFLRRMANTPVGQNEINNWIQESHENTSSESLRHHHQTLISSSRIQKFCNDIEKLGHENDFQIEKMLERIDNVISEYNTRTDVQDKLLEYIQDTKFDDEDIIIVVPKKFHVNFVENKIIEILGETRAKEISVVNQDSIKLISVNEYSVMIVAGEPEGFLNYLLIKNNIPPTVKLIFNASGAQIARSILNELISIDQFQAVHNRATSIAKQLHRYLKTIGKITLVDDLSISSLCPSPIYSYRNYSDGEAYAVLMLSGYGELVVGKNSRIVTYNKFSDNKYAFKDPDELVEGEHIFIYSDKIREYLYQLLEEHGINLSEKSIEDVVRNYHSALKERADSLFPNTTRQKRALQVLQEIKQRDDIAGKRISKLMISNWLKGAEESNIDETVATRSAQKKEDFIVFMDVMGLANLAETYWEWGIRALRSQHIKAGRHTSDLLLALLVDPTQAIAFEIENEQMNQISEIALKNTYILSSIEFISEYEAEAQAQEKNT